METASRKPYLIIISLLGITMIALFAIGTPSFVNTRPLNSLPENLENYSTDNIIFCHNQDCMSSVLESESDNGICPNCSAPLHLMALGEKMLFSEDTLIERRKYTDQDGYSFMVSIVMSGKERTDIHSPQVCLKGQGYDILTEKQQSVCLPGRQPLKITLLSLRSSSRNNQGRKFKYAYWFISTHHETASHFERLFLTAADNLLKSSSYRWAYISIMVPESQQEPTNILQSFINRLYPLITKKP